MRFLGDTPGADSKPEKDHKRRWDLVPLPLIAGLADVMAHGVSRAKGYAPFSWQHCPPERVVPKYGASAMRHLEAIQRGEHVDRDSGLLHAFHLMACAMIIAWHQSKEE